MQVTESKGVEQHRIGHGGDGMLDNKELLKFIGDKRFAIRRRCLANIKDMETLESKLLLIYNSDHYFVKWMRELKATESELLSAFDNGPVETATEPVEQPKKKWWQRWGR